MIFLIVFATLILGIGMITYTKKYIGTSANYIIFFNLLWMVGSILTSLGLYDSFVPPLKIYLYIFFMLLTFNVTTVILASTSTSLKEYSLNDESKFIITDKKKSRILLVILIALIVLIFPTFIRSVSYIMSNGFGELRSEVLTSKSLVQWILYHYGHPLILAIMVISTVDVIFYRKNFMVYSIGLICVIMYITIFASRWILAECILMLVLCLLQKYGNKLTDIIKNNKKIALLLLVGLSLLIYITSQRSLHEASILENIYYYFFGSIDLLGIFSHNLHQYTFNYDYLYGQAFFSGVVGVFADILRLLLGININTGIVYINEVVQGYEYVSPTIRMNNNVTMLYAFISDFGWFGLIIFPSLIAVFCFKCYKKAVMKTTKLNLAIYVYTFSILLFCIIEWFPGRATTILTFVFIYLLAGKKIRV